MPYTEFEKWLILALQIDNHTHVYVLDPYLDMMRLNINHFFFFKYICYLKALAILYLFFTVRYGLDLSDNSSLVSLPTTVRA